MILLADIGGTHVRYTFFENGKIKPIVKKECDFFKTPLDLLDSIYKEQKFSSAFLAVAGPVHKGKVSWTNRPNWTLSETGIQKRYHLNKVRLYNDMVAQGHGLGVKPEKKALLMNVGTGFGSCFLCKGDVLPCEFGLALTEDNKRKEALLSGAGIVSLYHQQGGDKKITSAKKIDESRQQNDKKAQKAYELFYQLWGKTAANIATGLQATDAVFLWGGLVPKNEKDKKAFLKSFYHKNYPSFIQRVPIKIVKNKFLTIKGLMNLIKDESDES